MPKADGYCKICRKPVPEEKLNKFYCSESCREEGWRRHHPGEEEPNWDAARATAFELGRLNF